MFNMLDLYYKNQPAIKKVCHLVPSWKKTENMTSTIKELLDALEPYAKLTTLLSTDSLMPTDAYKLWG